MALDFTKPVQTRSGLKVTILATEARGRFSVIGMIHEPTIDSAATWTAEGAFHADGREAPADLEQVPETVRSFVPVFDDGSLDSPEARLEDTDPHARYILELVYLGKRLESVNIIRRGEVAP